MAALTAVAATLLLWSAPAGAEPPGRWSSEIARASSRFGIPEAWIRRVIEVESSGEPMVHRRPAVSRAGAMGLMQLMPGTWRDMRAMLGLGGDPNNPADNILAGTAYLRLMYDRFGYPGLFAAYNAGPKRYSAFLAGAHSLPAETRAYVAAVAPVQAARFPGVPRRQPGRLPRTALRQSLPDGAPHAFTAPSTGLFVQLSSAIGR